MEWLEVQLMSKTWKWLGLLWILSPLFLRSFKTGLDGRVWDRANLVLVWSFLVHSLDSLEVPPRISCNNRNWSSERFLPLLPSGSFIWVWCLPAGLSRSMFDFHPPCFFVCLNTFGEEARPRLVRMVRAKLCWRFIGTIVTWFQKYQYLILTYTYL